MPWVAVTVGDATPSPPSMSRYSPAVTDLGLAGKRAVVTGGASGIGAAIAERLGREGARVGVLDVDDARGADVVERIEAAGGTAMVVHGDVRSAADVRAAIDGVADRWGGLDVLVNCAGILGPIASLVDYDEDEFVRVVDIDLVGTYRATRAAVPHLIANGWGRIVNVASISGKEGNALMTGYAAAKAGVVGFTKALGRELATSGVLVNCVTPGGVDHTNILQGRAPTVTDVGVSHHPMGRLAEPEEVAALVAWLCSAEVTFSTGGVFDISGGRASY
jgi:3-oxoacyl-[acyl-carrier protein] reductase